MPFLLGSTTSSQPEPSIAQAKWHPIEVERRQEFEFFWDRGHALTSLIQGRASGSPHARKIAWVYDSPLCARVYDLWCGLTESQAHACALNVASMRPGESVLEVAIGTGVLFAKLAGIDGLMCCVGLEPSEAMVSRARRRLPKQRGSGHLLCRGDARFLPFASGTFDLILNCYFMDLLSQGDICIALKELRRALKPTGRLVLLVMARQSPMLQEIWMWLYAHLPGLVGGCGPVSLAEYLIKEDWRMDVRERISQLGFRSELILARPVC